MPEKYFTRTEAEEKVSKRVRTLVEFSGVPGGTTGRVTSADSAGRVKPAFGETVEVYDVAVEWDMTTEPPAIINEEIAGETVTIIHSGKPLTDWFTKEEYERFLVEEE